MARSFTLNDPVDATYSKGKNNTSYLAELDKNMWSPSEEEKAEARKRLVEAGFTQYK